MHTGRKYNENKYKLIQKKYKRDKPINNRNMWRKKIVFCFVLWNCYENLSSTKLRLILKCIRKVVPIYIIIILTFFNILFQNI